MKEHSGLSYLFDRLQLGENERRPVQRYLANPKSRAFHPAAEVLDTQGYHEEAIELLTAGLVRHPSFTVARVSLAGKLYCRGLAHQAWQALGDSPAPLSGNVMAQRLLYRLALLLDLGAAARATYHHMIAENILDTETRQLHGLFQVGGIALGRQHVTEQLAAQGVTVVVPTTDGQGKRRDAIQALPFEDIILDFRVVALTDVFAVPSNDTAGTEIPRNYMPNDEDRNIKRKTLIDAKIERYARLLGETGSHG